MKKDFLEQAEEYIDYISDCECINQCQYFIDIVSSYLDNLHDGKKNRIGITSVAFPELFIRACGGDPVYIAGGYSRISGEADDMFPQISDCITKNIVNILFDKELNLKEKLEGVVVYVTNDSHRKIPYYLKENGYKVISNDNAPFLFDFTPESFKKEQKEIIKNITKITKCRLTKSKLIENARKITKSHYLFKKIDKSSLETKLKIFLKESYYLTSDIDKWQNEIEKLLMDIPVNDESVENLLITGCDIQFPNYKMYSILEETGITDYSSECCVPYPYDYRELNEDASLFMILKQVYDIHYKNQYCSSTISSNEIKFEENPNAVLFHLLKGQLPLAYHANKLEKNCIENNIPFLCVETDYTKADKEQVKIRVEAFTELLNVRKKYDKRRTLNEKQLA